MKITLKNCCYEYMTCKWHHSHGRHPTCILPLIKYCETEYEYIKVMQCTHCPETTSKSLFQKVYTYYRVKKKSPDSPYILHSKIDNLVYSTNYEIS